MAGVTDIAFVRYQAVDLDRMESFLQDFGLRCSARSDRALYMRANGRAHHVHITELGEQNGTVGFGLYVESEKALHELGERLGAAVEDNPEPGGGKRVRITDPAGFVVDLIFGQQTLEPLPHRSSISMNIGTQRTRFGAAIRLTPEPSHVLRLGHVALLVPDFQASFTFYSEIFGMRPSDIYFAGAETNEVAAFMHCGLGETWTDHHTVAIIAASDGRARFDHSAFEVLDLDDVMLGGEYLKARGRQHSWGVGRHVQGSQIFDYWRDPFGNKIEHWTDGDLVNDTTPVGRSQVSSNELQQWAPPLSPEFFE